MIGTNSLAQINMQTFVDELVGEVNGNIQEIKYSGVQKFTKDSIPGEREANLNIPNLMLRMNYGEYNFHFDKKGEVKYLTTNNFAKEGVKVELRNGEDYQVFESDFGRTGKFMYYDSVATRANYKETWQSGWFFYFMKSNRFTSETFDKDKQLVERKIANGPGYWSIEKFKRKISKGKVTIRKQSYTRNQKGELLQKEICEIIKGKKEILELEKYMYSEKDGVQSILETDLVGDTIQYRSITQSGGTTIEKVENFKSKYKPFPKIPDEVKKTTYSDSNFKTVKIFEEGSAKYSHHVYSPKGKMVSNSYYNNSLLLISHAMRHDTSKKHFKDDNHYSRYRKVVHDQGIDAEYKVYYTYDEKDNWITRTIKENGKVVSLQTREIIYR